MSDNQNVKLDEDQIVKENKKKEKAKKKRKRVWPFILAMVLLILVGVGLIAYPILASKYAESVRSEVYTQYKEKIEQIDTSELDAVRKAAEEYNHDHYTGAVNLLDPGASGYWEQLLVDGIDYMGYISISKIGVNLPIYHGIGSNALSKGVGHMPQSSLPIGGINTHAVLSAHTGMASSSMFSDLELLTVGDIFQIEILGETLTYQIMSEDDIKVVLPNEVDNIKIQTGEDLVTLVTCTPFGVNTHRLLVTGHRIENPDDDVETPAATEISDDNTASVWLAKYKSSVIVAVYIIGTAILVSVIFCVVKKRREKARKRNKSEKEEGARQNEQH